MPKITDPLKGISTRVTAQRERARTDQSKNSAGGYVFGVNDLTRLNRFLTLGTESGTYYVGKNPLSRDNADVVIRMAENDCLTLVEEIVKVSVAGRAPRQNPTIFALAVACGLGDNEGRKAALDAMPTVIRTESHMTLFQSYVEQFRGWGRGLKRAVANWYTDMDVDKLAYQMVKYRNRNGVTPRDMLRLSHPVTNEPMRRNLFDWACGRPTPELPDIVDRYEHLKRATSAKEVVGIIEGGNGSVSWEMIPDQWLSTKDVWIALISADIPQEALMRQLPRLTRIGVLTPMGAMTQVVSEQLSNKDRILKARLHPIKVLTAQVTYAAGYSEHSEMWTPVTSIVDSLDGAFYSAFGTVEPANKRTMIALDVSGSMGHRIGQTALTCRAAAGAMSLVTAATEPQTMTVGFTGGAASYHNRVGHIEPLNISPRQRLDDVIRTIDREDFGATDCAAPMKFALQEGLKIETFAIYTDNETWIGTPHPYQALTQYREKTGINARMVVVGMTSTGHSIADPNDSGSLDIAGFDSAVPNLISAFSRGDV